jgi:hypothetical protein
MPARPPLAGRNRASDCRPVRAPPRAWVKFDAFAQAFERHRHDHPGGQVECKRAPVALAGDRHLESDIHRKLTGAVGDQIINPCLVAFLQCDVPAIAGDAVGEGGSAGQQIRSGPLPCRAGGAGQAEGHAAAIGTQNVRLACNRPVPAHARRSPRADAQPERGLAGADKAPLARISTASNPSARIILMSTPGSAVSSTSKAKPGRRPGAGRSSPALSFSTGTGFHCDLDAAGTCTPPPAGGYRGNARRRQPHAATNRASRCRSPR